MYLCIKICTYILLKRIYLYRTYIHIYCIYCMNLNLYSCMLIYRVGNK